VQAAKIYDNWTEGGDMSSVNPVVAKAPPAASKPADTKLHRAAKDFEAMFMTEMLHQARPAPKASGVFATGAGEKSWQVFMDQALGQAAASQSGNDLTREIEQAMKAAQNNGSRK
jgi:Rod binding domain-containing protein